MQRPAPTRHNLHALEDRIEFGDRGHDVLQRKLEGLIMEFMDVLDRYKSIRSELTDSYETASGLLEHVWAKEGEIRLDGIARSRNAHPTLTVTGRSIMGVHIPLFESASIYSEISNRGYGLISTDLVVDDLVDSYELLVEELVLAAELKGALHVLIEEITITRRRVNILQKFLLPRLRDDAEYIRRHLLEREREERIQQKWYKLKENRTSDDVPD